MDIKTKSGFYRIDKHTYNRVGAIQYLESIGFTNEEAALYVDGLPNEEDLSGDKLAKIN